MASVEEVENCLVSLESQLVKLKAAEGSAVRFQKAETDIIGKIEKSRDIMMASLQDVTDKDRTKLLEAFGGDCRRIAKYRSVLQAITLSDKYSSDQRLPSSLNAVNLIENLLREKNYGDKLKAAQDRFIPWKNPSTNGGEAPVEPPAPKPAAAPAEEPTPAPAAVPAPAPPKPTLEAPKSTTETIVISEGEKFENNSDEKRNIMVEISVDVQPQVDPEQNGCIILKLPSIKVKLETSVTPPWPDTATPFESCQEFQLPIPEMAALVFDPVKKTPVGARYECSVSQHVDLMEIPADLEVSVKSKSLSPWGSVQLHDGSEMTVVHHTGAVQGAFSIADGDKTRALSIDLACKVVCMLSGEGSAKFTNDGVALEAPVHGG